MKGSERVMTMRAATLSRVIHTAADRRASATDRELLRRFSAGEPDAFEVLVRRHTGLVLNVCRRALPNTQDAEDACQVVFVILARKATSGRWQPSIANWLFATARKVACDLRRSADRRAKREGKAAVPEAVQPVDQMTGRELLAAIDEEMDRLPPIYREPLLLYYQAELGREEIAKRLGVPAGTVKIRLERGRKRLGEALTRRGLMLGAGLLALMATSRAGAAPPRLVDAIRAAVGGNVPPTVAALAGGAAVNGIVKKIGMGLILAAATVLAGFGLGEPRTTTAGPPPKEPTPAKETAKGEKDKPAGKTAEVKTRTITGKVLDPDGKPVAGAELWNQPIEGPGAVVGKTAADGTFSVTVELKGSGSWLFPRVAGFATNQFLMPATNTPAEVTFKLLKDTPIRGRLVDTQGKPVAGATLRVRHIEGFENDSLDDFLAKFQKRPGDGYPPPGKWSVQFQTGKDKGHGGQPFTAMTGSDGKFEITGVGPEREALVSVTGPGIADAQVEILTRAGFDPTPYNRETLEKIKSPYSELGYHPMLYPPDCNLVAEAEKPIRGVVTDAATGKPRAGVTVRMRETHNWRMPELKATTDQDGRYEIHGAKKTHSYDVFVKRDPATGFIGRTVKAQDTPAYEPVVANIPTARGVVLTGKLLDDQSGQPVTGFVCVGIPFDNEAAKTRPEFDSPDCYDFANTKADGVYRTVVPPGPILVMAGPLPTNDVKDPSFRYEQMKIDPDYPQYFDKRISGFKSGSNTTTIMQGQWCKVLKLKPDEPEVKFDIRFKRAARFTLKVQDPDGKPVGEVTATGNTARDWAQPERFKGDTVTVYELPTSKPRVVALLEPKRKLVGVVRLKGDEKEPVTATVGMPGRIKGKLVGTTGKPLAHVEVDIGFKDRAVGEIHRELHGERRFGGPRLETNDAGEFTMDLVVPGEKFWVYGRKKDQFLEPPSREFKFEAKAGAETDVGTVTLKGE